MGRRSLQGLSETDKGQEEDLFFGKNPCILQTVEFRVDVSYICRCGTPCKECHEFCRQLEVSYPSESEARLKVLLDVMLPVRYRVRLPPAPIAWAFFPWISTRFQIRRSNWVADRKTEIRGGKQLL